MKNLAALFLAISPIIVIAQPTRPSERQRRELSALIDQYSLTRETSDTIMLKQILTEDVDQLVSTGEWRAGIDAAVQGMVASSASAPGKRSLAVERIKMLHPTVAIVDCRYEIANADGTTRSMWSSFLAVSQKGKWRISSIRNMLPSRR